MWPPSVGNSWRTTADIQDNWASMINNIDRVRRYYTSHIWISFPFLRTMALLKKQDQVVGMILIVSYYFIVSNLFASFDNIHLVLEVGNGGMTDTEYVTHFSLWSITKAPLIIGCDVTKMTTATLSILTNPEVIAVNQDPLGIQGTKVAFASSESSNTSSEVIIANCSSSSSIEPVRRQWTYNPQDGSIRSVLNGRCLSIDHCNTGQAAYVVLDHCHIGDPQAQCQGKNQQWITGTINQTIVSQMDGKW